MNDTNDLIYEKLVNLLINKNYHISAAESCTGGLFAASVVSVANASKVLNESYVTYSEDAKARLVHVNPETISKYNVVSEEVAKEMAIGTANVSKSEVGVGITGIAGPTGGTPKIPTGTVCFGFYINGTVHTRTILFADQTRNEVRQNACNYAFNELIQLLSEKN